MPHFDLVDLIRTVGYIGISGIIFAETGFLVGFFLPGDSLLFTAGFLAAQGRLSIWILLPLCYVSAVLGYGIGYGVGQRVGPTLFRRQDSLLFKPDHVRRAEEFFERHGGKAVLLARFVPIARTFVPVVAGMGRMNYRRFTFFNLIGALPWSIGVTLLGYFLGRVIPDVDRYLLPAVIIIILLSLAPTLFHLRRERGSEIRGALRRQAQRNVPRR
jgi:membrane-associated protein